MLSKEIGTVSGVGKQRERLFFRLGIKTVEDMLCYYPRNYEDRSKIKSISETTDGESVCVKAVACTVMSSKRVRRGLSYQKLTVTDGTGVLFITWFNHDWLVKGFDLSAEYIYYGKISVKNGRVEVSNPVIVKDNKIEPIYPLTNGLTQNIFRAVMKNCLPFADEIPEALPERIRENHTLCGIDYAIRNVHFPQSFEKFDFARKRLAFEELFLLQLGLRMLRQRRGVQKGTPLCNDDNVDSFLSGLSFPLTNAQIRVKDEIISDLKKSRAMNRLVQGDVGSGKTVVAAVALLVAAKSGAQAAMMAPTEILAKQHYDNLSEMYNKMSIKTALLTGSLTASQKREICEKTQSGEIQIIIGTHTLIQDSISFKNLCLVVTDEQHRFGVKQRAALAEKGKAPHLLVMTATPIPRTLSLVLYGDLDVSVIDELPPGRKMIDTYAVGEEMRERINQFVLKQINEGRQVYIICPLVEEGEATELKAVREYAKSLREGAFAGRSVGVIHGRLKTKEKDAVMQSFADGKIDILVSTTVVEVGVNIPNASDRKSVV